MCNSHSNCKHPARVTAHPVSRAFLLLEKSQSECETLDLGELMKYRPVYVQGGFFAKANKVAILYHPRKYVIDPRASCSSQTTWQYPGQCYFYRSLVRFACRFVVISAGDNETFYIRCIATNHVGTRYSLG